MSTIAENLTRITQAKSDIKTSIENQAVDVNSNLTIDNYSELIDKIPLNSILNRGISGVYTNNVVKKLGNSVFKNCTYLTGFRSTSLETIVQQVFFSCSALSELYLPNVKDVQYASQGFYSCTSLKKIELPSSIYNLASAMFQSCTALEYADIGKSYGIQTRAFTGCTYLATLIIRKTNATSVLGNVDAFSNTKIANGMGYIYVPRSLIDNYKSATNWNTYSNQFRVLEEYTKDNTVTGEFDTSKL